MEKTHQTSGDTFDDVLRQNKILISLEVLELFFQLVKEVPINVER